MTLNNESDWMQDALANCASRWSAAFVKPGNFYQIIQQNRMHSLFRPKLGDTV